MTYTKFNIAVEVRKTLAGKPSKVAPMTLLQVIGPKYLQDAESEEAKDK
jgi:hypothetical protein